MERVQKGEFFTPGPRHGEWALFSTDCLKVYAENAFSENRSIPDKWAAGTLYPTHHKGPSGGNFAQGVITGLHGPITFEYVLPECYPKFADETDAYINGVAVGQIQCISYGGDYIGSHVESCVFSPDILQDWVAFYGILNRTEQ